MPVQIDSMFFLRDLIYRPKSGDIRVDSLAKGLGIFNGSSFSNAPGGVVKFGFALKSNVGTRFGNENMSVMSKSEQDVCIAVLKEASIATGIKFELATAADDQLISFYIQNNVPDGVAGLGYQYDGVVAIAPGLVGDSYSPPRLNLVLHELGHVLGLLHPFDVVNGYPRRLRG